jgi:class 3 adenylate cyclase
MQRSDIEALRAGITTRQVTVLFADMVGSTAMARAWTPKTRWPCSVPRCSAWPTSCRPIRAACCASPATASRPPSAWTRRAKTTPSVPCAPAWPSSGRAEQAGQARRQHGIADFAVRVGLHTGDVALGAGVEADNTAMGAAVNIAARMEQSTHRPGTLRISHDTWSQVRGLFDMQPQPPLQVKGVDAPMQTYLVRAALDRSSGQRRTRAAGPGHALVGRDAELQRLLHAVARRARPGICRR